MISALSKHLVESFDKDNYSPVNGMGSALSIVPWSVLVETTSKNWFTTSKEYKSMPFKLADIVKENSDALEKIVIHSKPVSPLYSKQVSLGSKLSIEIFKEIPEFRAKAYTAGGILMNIKTGGLTEEKIDETEFEKAMRKRPLDTEHSFFDYYRNEKNIRLCVVKSVLKTNKETVIEFTCGNDSNADMSAKVVGHGGSVSANMSNSNAETINLEADIALACRWQTMTIDESTWSISPEFQDSVHPNIDYPINLIAGAGFEPLPEYDGYEFEDLDEVLSSLKENISDETDKESPEEEKRSFKEPSVIPEDENISFEGVKVQPNDIIVYSSSEESDASTDQKNESNEKTCGLDFSRFSSIEKPIASNEKDTWSDDSDELDKDERDQDSVLYDLYNASEEQVKKFKSAISIVVRSTSDVEALIEVFDDKDTEAEKLKSKLENSGAVWTLLGLMGYKINNHHLQIKSRGPFILLIPKVIQAARFFDGEDIDFIRKCSDYHKNEILRIIKAADDRKEFVTLESKFLQELQNEPVEHTISLLDVKIDFVNGKVLLPSTNSDAHYPLKFLLHSL